MKLLNLDQTSLMEVTAFERGEDGLLIKGQILDSMPITCVLTPAEARVAIAQLGPRMIWYLLTFLFRR
jgi:hypothetical protein